MRLSSRLGLAAGVSALALFAATACSAPGGNPSGGGTEPSAVPDKPSQAVELTILDIAGNLQLTQPMIDAFVEAHPDIISKVTYTTGTSPDMPGKLKAQQDAGRVTIDLVLTGTDGLAAGIEQGLFTTLLPEFASRLTNMDNYLEPAAAMQELAQGQGVAVVYYPSGPVLEYQPSKVATPPTSPDELLAWAQANPGKFGYARPANSGPGRTFIMGLPYVLGDSDPLDPVNGWTKTWAYLKELNQYIDYYPTGTAATMTNLGNGTWDMVVSTTGWDINPRALGTVPADVEITTFDDFTWVTDAQYAVIPKGVSADKQAAILLLIQDMLTVEQNVKAYDTGYFYPGPAVQGATLDKAPAESQAVINQYGRPEYQSLIDNGNFAVPLSATAMVAAYDIWDREVGAAKTQS
ncbi:MAG: extracellular solute-binding protein [Propionibacteriaceae bacterium]|jgi:putative spermidine/putrescine transport system substrate-binding protein|nr:extracellular solute-binding protein [Propionibacteriaceae bacterium]